MTEFCEHEIQKAKDYLYNTEINSEDYPRVLDLLRALSYLEADVECHNYRMPLAAGLTKAESPVPEEPAPVEPEPVATPDMTIADIRLMITDMRSKYKGFAYQPIIAQFDPQAGEGKTPKLSNIPAAKYPELIEALKKAAEATNAE